MKVKVTTITPSQAEVLLRKNTRNRPVYAAHIKELAADMKTLNWRQVGDTIRIDWDGQILDGQHRLMAAVLSGQAIREAVLVTDLDPAVFPFIDTGKVRNGADTLGRMSVADYRLVNTSLRLLRYATTTGKRAKVGNAEIIELYEANPDISVSTEVGKKFKGFSNPSLITAMHCVLSRIDPVDADYFFDKLKTGTDLHNESHPILTLRTLIVKNSASVSKIHPKSLIDIMILSWNAYREGRLVSKFSTPKKRPNIYAGQKKGYDNEDA